MVWRSRSELVALCESHGIEVIWIEECVIIHTSLHIDRKEDEALAKQIIDIANKDSVIEICMTGLAEQGAE